MTKERESLFDDARIEGFTSPDEVRFSCIVWPTEYGWAWAVYDGDGSAPGSARGGSSAKTMADALTDAAEYVRGYPEAERG